jgi:pimeloyl-ACP methyl ester carboxylesterase
VTDGDREADGDLVWVTHVRVRLALHRLRAAAGRPLLLLHGLGERTPDAVPSWLTWPGPVWGLDFTGHGASTLPSGGGYTAELLMGDVDHALAHLGPSTLLGRGLGGYVSLLAAGARPELVAGVVVADGPGLAGGGPAPHSASILRAAVGTTTPDPYALVELAGDIRPADYATAYVRQALEFSGLDHPISVAAVVRPPWLEAVVAEPDVIVEPVDAALARLAAV